MSNLNSFFDGKHPSLQFYTSQLKIFFPKLLIATLIFLLGYLLAKKIKKALQNFMTKAGTDLSVIGFFSQIAFFAFILIIANISLEILGVPTTSFLAALGGLGLGIGLALQSNLSNFASGIIILMFKPFKVGDFIESQEKISGTVVNINTMTTCLNTIDNKKIYIPNSVLTNNYLINYSENYIRTLVLTLKLSYETDHNMAISTVRSILESHPLLVEKDSILTEISAFELTHVSLLIKGKVENSQYWDAYYTIMKEIKESFSRKNISFAHFERDFSGSIPQTLKNI